MPRKSSLSLRGRIVVAFGLLGFLLSLVFAIGVHLAYETVEHDLLIDMLERELDAREAPAVAPLHLGAIRIDHYADDAPSWRELPRQYLDRPPGFHEIGFNEGERHLLVKDIGDVRHVLVFQDANIERREEMLVSVLVAGVLIATYLSIWLGFVTSRRVIRPVRELAADVRRLRATGTDEAELHAQSDDEVGELAAAFADYRDQLHRFLQRERTFTGAISHELRTPLTVIGSNVDVLLAGELTGAQRERLQRMRRAVHEAADLVTTFLAMARSGGRLSGACDPAAVAQAVTGGVKERLGADIALDIADDAPRMLAAPPSLFTVVLRNLVNNALEHGRAPVTVRLAHDRIEVRDAGGGAPLAAKSGRLGMDIVQRLCERQGWSLDVVSRDATTCVSIRFGGH